MPTAAREQVRDSNMTGMSEEDGSFPDVYDTTSYLGPSVGPYISMAEFDCKAVGNGKGRKVFVGLNFILHVESLIDMLYCRRLSVFGPLLPLSSPFSFCKLLNSLNIMILETSSFLVQILIQ
jgi:hypothetical protein